MYDAEKFVQPDLRQRQLSLEQITVSIESIELRIDTAPISHIR